MNGMIVYVESPGQLVCAVEYVRRSGGQALFLSRTTGNAFGNAQLANALAALNVPPAACITSSKLLVLVAYFYRFLVTRRPAQLVIGDSRSLVAVFFANHFGKGKTVLVDDGIATITHGLRVRRSGSQFQVGLTGNRFKNRVLEFLSGISAHMRVFSTIDRRYLGLDTTLNDFGTLAGAHPVEYDAGDLCVIGSSAVEAGIVSEPVYRAILTAFLEIRPEARITYVPHRLERLEKLSELPRLTVVRTEVPIELHFLRSGKVPGTFATFYSGAGLALSRLFPDSTVLVKEIPVDQIVQDHKTNYLNIMAMYRHHESVGSQGIRIC